jgi:aspartate/methionine/tyrosine aminotransferase
MGWNRFFPAILWVKLTFQIYCLYTFATYLGISKVIADRMQQIKPFHVMELLMRARELEAQGHSIIHMEVGEPDFTTPEPIIQAGHQALDDGRTHYTPAMGLPELRQAIAAQYNRRFGLDIDHSRVVVTPGASGALQLLLSVLINPGDGVLLADPGYPCNRNFVHMVGGEPQVVDVGPDTDYQLSASLIERNWSSNTKAVMVASPSNPTGTMLSRQQLLEINRIVEQRGGVLIVDEIYQGLVYEAEEHSALEISDRVFVINSFSKYFGMTGWRLGWLVAPQGTIGPLDRLAQNIFLCAPTLSQYAALAAFSDECIGILEQRKAIFKQRRDYLMPALEDLGFRFQTKPQGAFYLYGDCSRHTNDSTAFAHALLEQMGVAVTPGMDFGANAPEKHLRFAYTTDIELLREGVSRIKQFVGR